MTTAQQTWLCHTHAHVQSIAFGPHDPASALLLTDRHRLHARLEEAHGLYVNFDDDRAALAVALTVLPWFAGLRVLSLQNWGHWKPAFMLALPSGLRCLTYSSGEHAFCSMTSNIRGQQRWNQLQVCCRAAC